MTPLRAPLVSDVSDFLRLSLRSEAQARADIAAKQDSRVIVLFDPPVDERRSGVMKEYRRSGR